MRGVPEPFVPPPAGLSASGLLRWVCRLQWTSILAGVTCDTIWLLGLALTPWAIGRVVDEGLVARDPAAFGLWIGVVIWLQLQHSLIQAAARPRRDDQLAARLLRVNQLRDPHRRAQRHGGGTRPASGVGRDDGDVGCRDDLGHP